MTNWEVYFRIRYDYPFVRMSERYPDTRISMWCVWEREMVHVPLDHEGVIKELESFLADTSRMIETYKPTATGYVLTLQCTCNIFPNVLDLISRNRCLDVPPYVFMEGWGHYRIISFSEEDIKSLFEELSRLGRVELISKKALHSDIIPSSVRTESFFSGMTDRQAEAIIKAYDHGYYSSPRRATTDSIATSLGISRSTYEEHLRKAENRIMDSILPYLKLFRSSSRKHSELISPEISLVTEVRE